MQRFESRQGLIAKRYFTDALLLWNEYSLETFVKIAQHPIFGPSIRRVQLSCAHYDPHRFYDTVDDIKGKGYGHREFSALIQRLSQRCDDQTKNFHGDELLDRAFSHLGKSNQNFVLVTSTNEDLSLGRSKIWVSDMRSEIWAADLYSSLISSVEAADKSACRVRKLEVEIDTVSGCNLGTSKDFYNRWKESKSVRFLSELTLNLTIPPYDYQDLGLILSLLSLPVHLKTLHVRANIPTRNNSTFSTLARLISCLPLKELQLADLCIRQDSMTDLLEDLGSTLCRLKITKCDVNGSWKDILLSTQQHTLQLDDLHINDTKRFWLKETVTYKGIINVRLGVARLLQEREDMLQDVESESQLESDSDGD
jgi:hypothetical protein